MSFNLLGAISSVLALSMIVLIAATIGMILVESKRWWVMMILLIACAFIMGGIST